MFSVTVGVTCKNNARTIKKCIDSLLNLDYPKTKYKVFVVDSFSDDGTYEILKKYGKKIRLKQVKSNIAKGHNFIIKNSTSDVITLTDSDCVADKNWLKEMVKLFENKEIGAVTGLVKTPRNVSKLQEIIGRELESRFEKFPEFVSRGPTMNLAFRSRIAKKILFDERYDVAQETDWGYRFTKNYKMAYNPMAIVYHYHRASWKGFFRQQFKYAQFVPKVYFKGHLTKIRGDKISTTSMMLQIFFIYLGILSAIISIFNLSFIYLSFTMFLLLLFSYLVDIIKLSKSIDDAFLFIALFIVRNVAWTIGILIGVIKLVYKT